MTELVFILDASGSMHGLEKDTVGGFNSMLKKQRGEEGEALVTTVLFDTELKTLHDRVPIEKVEPLTEKDYCPGGCTALLDAVGSTVEHIGTVHRYARKEDLPEATLFVITTDGLENASRRFGYEQVRRLVEEKKALGWQFLFLGANIDSAREAGRFGIDRDFAVDYRCDAEGTALNYECIAEAVHQVRTCAAPLSAAWKAPIVRDTKRRGK